MSITPESTKTEQSKHSDMITAFEAQASAGKKTIPAFNCWSSGDGECWHTHPADACILDTVFSDGAPKVGDEYEVLAGWRSVEARYRITSVDEDGDVEVECISHAREAAPQPDRVAKLETEVERLRGLLSGLVDDIQGLMSESDGVAGLHLNGDVAPWSELEAGARFERLTHLPEAALAGKDAQS